MTKNIHNGLGVNQRMILRVLEVHRALDAVMLTAKIYGVEPDLNIITNAQYSGVRRALKQLHRAGKVGIVSDKKPRRRWATAEQLAKAVADYDSHSFCLICREQFRDGDLIFILEVNDDDDEDSNEVHAACCGRRRAQSYDYYENPFRQMNGMSNARDKDQAAVDRGDA